MGLCVSIISDYSYIATVPAVEQWYFHFCSATLGLYRIPCLK